jgi:hypothetical protein
MRACMRTAIATKTCYSASGKTFMCIDRMRVAVDRVRNKQVDR